MKAYTDIEQSKKLSIFLPVESADMHYCFNFDLAMNTWWRTIPNVTKKDNHFELYPNDIPCWSLAALLEVLPRSLDDRYNFELGNPLGNSDWYIIYVDTNHLIKNAVVHGNLIDACVEMILKLKEKNLL